MVSNHSLGRYQIAARRARSRVRRGSPPRRWPLAPPQVHDWRALQRDAPAGAIQSPPGGGEATLVEKCDLYMGIRERRPDKNAMAILCGELEDAATMEALKGLQAEGLFLLI